MICPYCDADFLMAEALARHLFFLHGDVRFGVNKGPLAINSSGDKIRCVCGEWFRIAVDHYAALSPFARHLQAVGGMAAHLLPIALGLDGREGLP